MRKHSMQIHLDAPLIEWLRTEAVRRSISIGEVVREAIRRTMLAEEARESTPDGWTARTLHCDVSAVRGRP